MGTFVADGSLFTDRTNTRAETGVTSEVGATHVNALKSAALDLRLHTSGWINPKTYGATGDGTTDDTSALQLAAAAAIASGKGLYLAAGAYKVSSTITGASNLVIRGEGQNSILRPTISDLSPVINFPANAENFILADFAIASSISGSSFNAGSVEAQQCTGIKLTNASKRWHIRNVHVFGVKIGYDATGWIATGDNVWATYCEIGFKGSTLNSADLNLRLENNRQSFAFSGSGAVLLRQLLDEGANTLSVASTIDSCNAVTIIAPYWEGSSGAKRSHPYLSVGSSSAVRQFRIVGAIVTGSSGMQTGVFPIALDQVDGADIDGTFYDGSQTRKVSTTANTKDFRLAGSFDYDWFTDGSNQLGTAWNYWPNRNFDLWFRGWYLVTTSNATIAQETSIVRKGKNAVRITPSGGSGSNRATFYVSGAVVTALRGKTVRVGVWMWIPDFTSYTEGSFTLYPSIVLNSYNGAATVSSTTRNNRTGKAAWNFLTAEVAVQSDATQITVQLYANQSGTVPAGGEYVVVDSISLTEASTPYSRQLNDSLVDAALIPAVGVAGKMIATGTAAPTDTAQAFELGDLVLHASPTAGGSQGWVCTTAGSPGTWTPLASSVSTASLPTIVITYTSGGAFNPGDVTATSVVKCDVNDGVNFGFNSPSNSDSNDGRRLTFRIANVRGDAGAIGVCSLGSQFKSSASGGKLFSGTADSTFGAPKDGYNRSVTFQFDKAVYKWFEVSRTIADVPN